MGDKMKKHMEAEDMIIFVTFLYAWFNIFTFLFSSMPGMGKAFLSLMFGILTYNKIGEKAAELFL